MSLVPSWTIDRRGAGLSFRIGGQKVALYLPLRRSSWPASRVIVPAQPEREGTLSSSSRRIN